MLARDPVKTSNPYGALNGRSANGSASTTPTAALGGAAGDKKKKKKKKKKKAPSSTVSSGDADDADNQESNNETAQLPLPRRLEVAASHADIHAALVGLVGWSRLSINTDVIMVFFQCDALRLLLLNILTVRPKQEAVYENLVTLLANCLSVDRGDKSGASNRQVATAVVDALRALMERLPSKCEGDAAEGVAASADTIAAYLSAIVVKYRASLSGVGHESALSHDVLKIETQLKAAAARDSEVKGQTIRDSFQRRDIRSDALVLYESRLEKIVQLASQSSTLKEKETPADVGGGFLAFALKDSEDQLHVDEKEVEEVKSRVATLEIEKTAKLQLVQEKKAAQEQALSLLQKEREALEAKLRIVNDQIQTVLLQQVQLESEATAIEDAFKESTARFDDHHQRVLQAYAQKERRDQLQEEFAKLENTISTIAHAQDEEHSLLEKHAVCLRQQLEGALRYFGSELPCVKFMMNRVEETKSEMQKVLQEASGYEALGVHAVSKDLSEKVDAMRSHLEEDTKCVEALQKRDMEVVAMMEDIFRSKVHAPALERLDEHLKKEARRHIEYVKKIHSDAETTINNGSGLTPPQSKED